MTIKHNSTTICILGMHRSGTSTISRITNLLGVYLGEPDKMTKAKSDNPKGFWEHIEILNISQNILDELPCCSGEIFMMPYEWWKLPEINKYKMQIIQILKNEFSDTPLWGFKDPRTCVLLPIWKEIFGNLNIQSRYIFIFRNPLDVALSLEKRHGSSLRSSFIKWNVFNLSALYETENFDRIIIKYDQLLEDNDLYISKINSFIDQNSNVICSEEIQNFVDTSLRHRKSSVNELQNHLPSDLGNVIETYKLLLEAEQNPQLFNSDKFKYQIREHYYKFLYFLNEKRNWSMVNTLSWKLTKPLRTFGRFIR